MLVMGMKVQHQENCQWFCNILQCWQIDDALVAVDLIMCLPVQPLSCILESSIILSIIYTSIKKIFTLTSQRCQIVKYVFSKLNTLKKHFQKESGFLIPKNKICKAIQYFIIHYNKQKH